MQLLMLQGQSRPLSMMAPAPARRLPLDKVRRAPDRAKAGLVEEWLAFGGIAAALWGALFLLWFLTRRSR